MCFPGLSLVVAFFPHWRLCCNLLFHLRCSLLLHQVEHWRFCFCNDLLQLQPYYGFIYVPVYR